MEKIDITVGAVRVTLSGLGAIAIAASATVLFVAILLFSGGFDRFLGQPATAIERPVD